MPIGQNTSRKILNGGASLQIKTIRKKKKVHTSYILSLLLRFMQSKKRGEISWD